LDLGLNLVYVLTACTARPRGLHLDVCWIDLDIDRIVDHRIDERRGK
jgi:hypothetical protein